jgi:hypothetical protein
MTHTSRRRPRSKATFCRHCPLHFVGVWDTVSSVWIWDPLKRAKSRYGNWPQCDLHRRRKRSNPAPPDRAATGQNSRHFHVLSTLSTDPSPLAGWVQRAPRVLGFGSFQDGDVGAGSGFFPEGMSGILCWYLRKPELAVATAKLSSCSCCLRVT